MKKLILSLSVLLISVSVMGQITRTTIKETMPEKNIEQEDSFQRIAHPAVPYDSLSNILWDNIHYHVGQTLYCTHEPNDLRGVENFYTKPNTEDEYVYKPIKDEKKKKKSKYLPISKQKTQPSEVLDKYYYFTAIIKAKNKGGIKQIFLELKEENSKDTLYFHYLGLGHNDSRFLNVGYFEKIKKDFLNKNILFKKGYFSPLLLKGEGEAHQKDIKDSIYLKCVDVTLLKTPRKRDELAIIFEDDKGESLYTYGDGFFRRHRDRKMRVDSIMLSDSCDMKKAISRAGTIEDLKKSAEERKARKENTATLKIGMTPSECLTIWGSPKNKTTSTSANSESEMWSYGDGRFLHFRNGKLVRITK